MNSEVQRTCIEKRIDKDTAGKGCPLFPSCSGWLADITTIMRHYNYYETTCKQHKDDA